MGPPTATIVMTVISKTAMMAIRISIMTAPAAMIIVIKNTILLPIALHISYKSCKICTEAVAPPPIMLAMIPTIATMMIIVTKARR